MHVANAAQYEAVRDLINRELTVRENLKVEFDAGLVGGI